MEYRQLPHGNEHEKFGVLGLGMGGIKKTPANEIEAIIRKAIDHGINFFDLCAGGIGSRCRNRACRAFCGNGHGAGHDRSLPFLRR